MREKYAICAVKNVYLKGCQMVKKRCTKKVRFKKKKFIIAGFDLSISCMQATCIATPPKCTPCFERACKSFIKTQLKLNGKGVYLRFAERIQVSFTLHPCTNFTVNDEQW